MTYLQLINFVLVEEPNLWYINYIKLVDQFIARHLPSVKYFLLFF